MKRLQYTVAIAAPAEKVWNVVVGDATYRDWTTAFNPGGSYFEGGWNKGDEIRFLGPDPETGKLGGMYSRIAESRPAEFVSIEHVGMIQDGQIDTTSEMVKKWTPAFENYTFKATGGGTELVVDLDTSEDFVEFFDEAWPQALQRVKTLAEA